ncbi:MAG: PD40 domain-containing protein [Roseiflexaceae bacterium]|nr:PD40 domain-containing protein [Roseiflexaceae bacterium]
MLTGCSAALPSQPAANATDSSLPGRLLYARNGDLWQWDQAGARQITERGNLAQPTWSPDGASIVAVEVTQSASTLVVLPAAGGEPRITLADGASAAPLNSYERAQSTTWARYPAFSADGSQILYASQAGPASGEPAVDYNMTLYATAPLQGALPTQLYAADDGHVGDLAVAPSGATVFAFQPLATDAPMLREYDETAGAAREIAGMLPGSYDPAFTPDGAWLLFAARHDGATDIYAIPSGGGTATQLTTGGMARAPAVSPDGAWLAWLALSGEGNFDLYVAPLTVTSAALELGEPRALTTAQAIDADSGLSWGQ